MSAPDAVPRPSPQAAFAYSRNRAITWARWALRVVDEGLVVAPPQAPLPLDALGAWRLEPLVFAALSHVDDPRRSALVHTARTSAGVNLQQATQLPALGAALDQAGLDYAVYKGAALVVAHPAWRATREVADVDLLVDPADAARAYALLAALGFVEQRGMEPVSIGWNNERIFVRPHPELHLDVHTGLHRRPLFSALSAAILREAVVCAGVRVAPDRLAPLIIAAHRAKAGMTGDARELVDFYRLLALLPDAELHALPARAAAFDMRGALYAVWTVTRRWFGPSARADATYRALRDTLGPRRAGLDALVARDGPSDANKPWRALPFLKMYAPMPWLTGATLTPLRLAVTHGLLRSADVAVARRDVRYSTPPR